MSADVAGELPTPAPALGVAQMTALVDAAATTTAAAVAPTVMQVDDDSDSELSELDEDGARVPKQDALAPSGKKDDVAETGTEDKGDGEASAKDAETEKIADTIEPAHWDDGVPVFKPTMADFADFQEYMTKVNPYGMQTGIVKVIPPQEWRDQQPPLDDIVKTIRAPNPIIQEIMAEGAREGHRVLNLQAHKIYNLPQWYNLCQKPEHQPPARRGERRANQDKVRTSGRLKREKKEDTPAEGSPAPTQGRKKRGRPAKKQKLDHEIEERLPTPTSPAADAQQDGTVKPEPVEEEMTAPAATGRRGGRLGGGGGRGGRMGGGSSTTVSGRRKNASNQGPGKINEADFVDFNYKMDISDYTKERCEELERAYWRTLTYAPPLYGADMLGSLFDERTTTWNLGNLPNLLDVMGTKVPGVNTAYLYLGMWKATFAWHLEDVDLYSINYLHFGAPKQWYSISQKDARKFEGAMANIWPQDAKACDQFLRHKTFIISPTTLLNKYGVKVNRTTHYPGEFVITFPYGYHSGFNMGYNCAEAVNFALPSWLEMGRIAKKCDCEQAQDSVWIDVKEIERKLRGEETDYDDSDEEEDDGEEDDGPTDLPTPPESSGDTKLKQPRKKKKRVGRKPADANKKIKIRLRTSNEPCCLCPNDIRGLQLLPTDDGRKAHRICGEYTPETDVENNKIYGVKAIDKARLELKCIYCRNRKGAKIQCSQKKCARAYHATCAAAAGMFVEHGEIPVFGEDGTEYKTMGCSFSCRFHRVKRDKKIDISMLEDDVKVQNAARELQKDSIAQFQMLGKDIFAGLVVENRVGEGTLLVEVLPSSERVEVEYKYLLLPGEADFHLQKPSDKALPLPRSRNAKKALKTSDRHADDLPRKDDIFAGELVWAEFNNLLKQARNPDQVKVDFTKAKQILHYIGDISKESTAYFNADPLSKINDPSVAFLNTVPRALPPRPHNYAPAIPRSYPQQQQYTPNRDAPRPPPILPPGYSRPTGVKQEKPYEYKPRKQSYTPSYLSQPSPNQQQQSLYSTPNANRQQYNSYGQSYGPTSTSNNLMGNYYSGAFKPGTGPLGAPAKLTPESYLPFPISPAAAAPVQPRPVSQAYPSMRRSSVSNEVAALMNKYPYLKKEHNRPASTYKSPYRQGEIGFCNGYEGDFKAHMKQMMAKDPSLLMKTSIGRRNSLLTSPPSASAPPASAEYGSKTYAPILPPTKAFGAGILDGFPVGKPQTQNANAQWEKKATPLHPAIRSDYTRGLFHQNYRPANSPQQGGGGGMSMSPSDKYAQQQRPQPQYSANWNQPTPAPAGMYHGHHAPMTPHSQSSSSPALYSSRPTSSSGPQQYQMQMNQMQQPQQYAHGPVETEEQRRLKLLAECTPPARSFYGEAYKTTGSSSNLNKMMGGGGAPSQSPGQQSQGMGQNGMQGQGQGQGQGQKEQQYYMGFDAVPQYAPASSHAGGSGQGGGSTARPGSAAGSAEGVKGPPSTQS